MLFLDEIMEMRAISRTSSCAWIEEKTVLQVGGAKEISIDVRFLSASNRPRIELSSKDAFREDRYYRLSGLSIHPPTSPGNAPTI